MNLKPGVLIIPLGKVYDIAKFGEIIELSNSINAKDIKHIIVDAHELTNANIMGIEILALKDKIANSNRYSLVFAGLKNEIASIFHILDDDDKYGELINFNSVLEAITFINTIDEDSSQI